MGITPLHARLIVEEHKRRPLPSTVHLLGRQTVYLTVEAAERLMRGCGVQPAETLIELDRKTRGAAAQHKELISDRMFFGLLGVEKVLAIDHTDYEGAELIIDLNVPLAEAHVGTVDFLFGGSVLDNIFDGATYMVNVSKLLRPAGRMFDQNVISQVHHPYLLVTPAWMLDYYVVNQFKGLQLFVAEHSPSGFMHMYGVLPSPDGIMSDFGPPLGGVSLGIMMIAEKGFESTADILPIQDQYRSEADKVRYRSCVESMAAAQTFPTFAAPTPLEVAKVDVRRSKNYRYLGVIRPGDVRVINDFDGRIPDSAGVGGLRVASATYGGGFQGVPPAAGICAAYRGNVTDILACLANGHDSWQWVVDVSLLGDPLPTVGKDLEVIYYFEDESERKVRRAYLGAEAHGKTLILSRDAGR